MEEAKNDISPEYWVRQYADQLFKFAVARVSDPELAKDLVQDTFLSALKGQKEFRGEISEKNWLYAILKNKIIDHYRKKATQSITELNILIEEAQDYFDDEGSWKESARPKEWAVDYSQPIEQKEFYKVLERCKRKMAELLNAVFTLKYFDDKDSEEICKELNISSSNYWVLLHRARLKIRECLEVNWFIK
jgi:RNA polymerase sigma-70 factor (TIGR02943 family)